MPTEKTKPQLVFVLGPTASGKTEITYEIAEKISSASKTCQIINCDSLQVYQGLDIGTAKPTLEERKRFEHKLFDIVPIGENFTAGDYRTRALECIESAAKESIDFLIFVGGSGFYVSALVNGMFSLPKISKETTSRLEKMVSEKTARELFDYLAQVDPESAQKLHINDQYRIQRAIEVYLETGKPISRFKKDFENLESPIARYEQSYLGLSLERRELRERVEKRTKLMLKNGLVDETKNVISFLGEAAAEWKPLSSVGYKEVQMYVEGEIKSENELASLITQSTMQLAKRQSTWFRNQMNLQWLHPVEDCEKILDIFK